MNKDDVFPFEDRLIILDPAGLQALKEEVGYRNVTSVFIDAPIDLLIERGKSRGDSAEEVQRRLHADRDAFISAKYFADIVIDPPNDDIFSHITELEHR